MIYTNDLVLLAKEKKTGLQSMTDKINETRRCYEIEMKVEKTKVMKISIKPSPVQFITNEKQPENMQYFNCLGSMITNNARCTREIKSRVAMTKAPFNRKKTLFTSKLDLNLRKKLLKCYIWSIACMVLKLGHFGK